MHELAKLVITFVASLAATVVVAACFCIAGKKTDVLNVFAIPAGITIAEALRWMWPTSDAAFVFVLAGLVGISAGGSQYAKLRRSA